MEDKREGIIERKEEVEGRGVVDSERGEGGRQGKG